jgi:hypothetical protein
VGFETEPVCLKRDRTATGKWIENPWQFAVAMQEHLAPRFCVHFRMLVKLLPHHFAQNDEQTFSFRVLHILRWPFFWVLRWIIHY